LLFIGRRWDAHPPADAAQGAPVAAGRAGATVDPTQLYQRPVRGRVLAGLERRLQRSPYLLVAGAGRDDPQAARHARYVGVDGERRHRCAEQQDDVRRLRADARQLHERRAGRLEAHREHPGQVPPVPLEHGARYPPYVPGPRAVNARRPHGLLQRLQRRPGQRSWRDPDLPVQAQEGAVAVPVVRVLGEHGRYQDPEGVRAPRRDQVYQEVPVAQGGIAEQPPQDPLA